MFLQLSPKFFMSFLVDIDLVWSESVDAEVSIVAVSFAVSGLNWRGA